MLAVSTRKLRANQGKYLEVSKNGTDLPKEYILTPDEELARAITGEELLEKLIPRIEKLFDNRTIPVSN